VSGFLLDTHVWLWYLGGEPRLPPAVRDQIRTSLDECWLSPVSVWEAGILRDRGKIRLEGDFRTWFEESRRRLPLRTAPLNAEVALASLESDLPHRDPADRFLAATARTYQLTLVTADGRLLDCESLATLSARE
jgi:PIN domain nuclease of toxin-antitoxin system